MRRLMVSLLVPAVLAVSLGGCGQSASEKRDIATADAIVRRYSESSGASACSLLTIKQLKALYGKFTASAKRSHANCVKASRRFRGEPVEITSTELLDPHTIKVNAADQDGKFTYQVNLRKGSGGRWRIDLVTQAKVTTF